MGLRSTSKFLFCLAEKLMNLSVFIVSAQARSFLRYWLGEKECSMLGISMLRMSDGTSSYWDFVPFFGVLWALAISLFGLTGLFLELLLIYCST